MSRSPIVFGTVVKALEEDRSRRYAATNYELLSRTCFGLALLRTEQSATGGVVRRLIWRVDGESHDMKPQSSRISTNDRHFL